MYGDSTALPFIDRLGVEVDADPDTTWNSLTTVLTRSLESSGARLAVRMLGSVEVEASGPRPLSVGSTLPGFRVSYSTAPRRLVLDGSHRFARNEMAFDLADLGNGRTELAVVTRAEFPGPIGTLYRTLVIGSGGHVIATRRLLNSVAREAADSGRQG